MTDQPVFRGPVGHGGERFVLRGLRVLHFDGPELPIVGRFLADFGADVICVDTPIRDRVSPYYARPELELALRRANQRSVASDVDTLRKLIGEADVLITSDGRLESLGFDVGMIRSDFPQLIVAHVSSFGSLEDHWRGSNLTLSARGGYLYQCGSPDGAPVETRAPLAYGQAGAQCLAAVTLALEQRRRSGTGMLVSVSGIGAVLDSLGGTQEKWFFDRDNDQRGTVRRRGRIYAQSQFRCRDGYIAWYWYVGTGWGRKTEPVVEWMKERGQSEGLEKVDWEHTSIFDLDQEIVDTWSRIFAKFWQQFTKEEILTEALRRSILLSPVNSPHDILADRQLVSRGAFTHFSTSKGQLTVPRKYFQSKALLSRSWVEHPIRAEEWQPRVRIPWKTSPSTSADLPLSGLRVVDFSWAVAGPLLSKYLGMFGAEVIKVEWRERPDATRVVGPYATKPGMERSAGFTNHNVSKRSVAVNLEHPGGQDLMKRLVAASDIVVENFRTGVMERLGLGYSDLLKVRPDLIMASLSLQGRTGPRALQPGVGTFFKAAVGVDYLTPAEDGSPAGPNYPYPDWVVPWFALAGIILALEERRHRGRGAYLDVSQYETMLHLIAPALVASQTTDSPSHIPPAPYGVFPCAGSENWVALAVWSDEEWSVFSRIVNQPWADDPRFLRAEDRSAHEDELRRLLTAWLGGQDRDEVEDRLQKAGVDCAIVARGEDLHEPLGWPPVIKWVEQPKMGAVPVNGPSFVLGDGEPDVRPAPLLGADTDWLCREVLHLSDEEIVDLVASGAIGG